MLAIFLALLSAFGFGSASVFAKFGMRSASAMSAAVLSTLVNVVIYWPVILATGSLSGISKRAIALFMLAGVLSPALGRFFIFLGIDRLGVTRSHPIMASMPIVTTVVAVTAFGEAARLPLIAGTLICVGGVAQLAVGHDERHGRRRDFIFPILGAVTFGISINFRHLALTHFPSAIVGSAITITTGMTCLALVSFLRTGGRDLVGDRRSVLYFTVAGLLTLVAVYANFRSLQVGNIIVVTTLMNTSPLFSLTLSFLLLRKSELITMRVVLATGMIVLGASMVTVWR